MEKQENLYHCVSISWGIGSGVRGGGGVVTCVKHPLGSVQNKFGEGKEERERERERVREKGGEGRGRWEMSSA